MRSSISRPERSTPRSNAGNAVAWIWGGRAPFSRRCRSPGIAAGAPTVERAARRRSAIRTASETREGITTNFATRAHSLASWSHGILPSFVYVTQEWEFDGCPHCGADAGGDLRPTPGPGRHDSRAGSSRGFVRERRVSGTTPKRTAQQLTHGDDACLSERTVAGSAAMHRRGAPGSGLRGFEFAGETDRDRDAPDS
jgi:hypothetical protein